MPATLADLPEDVIRIIITIPCTTKQPRIKHVLRKDLPSQEDTSDERNHRASTSIEDTSEDGTLCYRCGKDCFRMYEQHGDCHVITLSCCGGTIIKKESLSVQDTMNLRATCKHLSNCLVDFYLTEFPKCRLAKTGHAAITMTPSGLRGLYASSTSQLIANSIRALYLNIGSIPLVSWSSTVSYEECLRSGASDYRKLVETGEDVQLLQLAFSQLPNLQEIYVGKWMGFEFLLDFQRHQTMDKIARRGSATEFKNHNNRQGAGSQWRSDVLKGTLNAVALSSTSVRKLIVQGKPNTPGSEEAGMWGFDLPLNVFPRLASSLAQLMKIHLTVSFGKDRPLCEGVVVDNGAPAEFTEEKGASMLAQFLSRMPQLEVFHLATSGDNTFTVSCIQKVLRVLPLGLKEFHLFNSLMTVPVLCVFLNAHRQNLKQIGLCRIFLTRERWTRIFGIMQSFMLPCLENIFFEQLWELQPQFGEKVFFHRPRGYTGPSDEVFGHRIYSIGKGSRTPGKFPDGEWSPDVRYDAMVMIKSWFRKKMIDSPEEGLEKAIKEGKREACGYGSKDIDDPLPDRVLDHVCKVFGKKLEEFKIQPDRVHRSR